MTTLTTIGYGDYLAKNTSEMITNMAIMFLGVTFFGLIMGSIGNELSYYNEVNNVTFNKLMTLDL